MKPIIVKVNSPKGFAVAKAMADTIYGGSHYLYNADRPAHVRIGSGSAFNDHYGYECDLEYYAKQFGSESYTYIDLTEKSESKTELLSIDDPPFPVVFGYSITKIGCSRFTNAELLRVAELIRRYQE